MKPRQAMPILMMLLLTGCWPSSRQVVPPVDPVPPPPDPPPSREVTQSSPYRTQTISRPSPPVLAPAALPNPEPPPRPLAPAPIRPAVLREPESPPTTALPSEPVILRKTPRDPAVVEALRCLLDKRPHDAVTPLEKLDKPTQDLLLRLLPLVARLSEGTQNTNDTEELEEVIRLLRARSTLELDRICFCRRIDKFGQYEPLPNDYRFKPGEMVQVYVELQNFSIHEEQGMYETRLASSVEIQDAQNQTVWRQDFKDRDRPDRSRSPRHDYFNSYRFCIPENLPPGTYRLVVRIADVHLPERKPAERTLPLEVTTRPRPLAEHSGAR
jgi:hypothetical protein